MTGSKKRARVQAESAMQAAGEAPGRQGLGGPAQVAAGCFVYAFAIDTGAYMAVSSSPGFAGLPLQVQQAAVAYAQSGQAPPARVSTIIGGSTYIFSVTSVKDGMAAQLCVFVGDRVNFHPNRNYDEVPATYDKTGSASGFYTPPGGSYGGAGGGGAFTHPAGGHITRSHLGALGGPGLACIVYGVAGYGTGGNVSSETAANLAGENLPQAVKDAGRAFALSWYADGFHGGSAASSTISYNGQTVMMTASMAGSSASENVINKYGTLLVQVCFSMAVPTNVVSVATKQQQSGAASGLYTPPGGSYGGAGGGGSFTDPHHGGVTRSHLGSLGYSLPELNALTPGQASVTSSLAPASELPSSTTGILQQSGGAPSSSPQVSSHASHARHLGAALASSPLQRGHMYEATVSTTPSSSNPAQALLAIGFGILGGGSAVFTQDATTKLWSALGIWFGASVSAPPAVPGITWIRVAPYAMNRAAAQRGLAGLQPEAAPEKEKVEVEAELEVPAPNFKKSSEAVSVRPSSPQGLAARPVESAPVHKMEKLEASIRAITIETTLSPRELEKAVAGAGFTVVLAPPAPETP